MANFSPGPIFCRLLATVASQRRHVSSSTDFEDGFFQIEGHGVEEKFQLDLGHSEIARAAKSVAALEGAEDALHL